VQLPPKVLGNSFNSPRLDAKFKLVWRVTLPMHLASFSLAIGMLNLDTVAAVKSSGAQFA
jgi:hypothetical protein